MFQVQYVTRQPSTIKPRKLKFNQIRPAMQFKCFQKCCINEHKEISNFGYAIIKSQLYSLLCIVDISKNFLSHFLSTQPPIERFEKRSFDKLISCFFKVHSCLIENLFFELCTKSEKAFIFKETLCLDRQKYEQSFYKDVSRYRNLLAIPMGFSMEWKCIVLIDR